MTTTRKKLENLCNVSASKPILLDDEFFEVSGADCAFTCGSTCGSTCENTCNHTGQNGESEKSYS